MAKLHGFLWSQWQGVFVDTVPGVVTDPAWTSVSLWYNTWWAKMEVGELLGQGEWNDDPLSFVDHVNEFRLQEFNVFITSFMRTSMNSAL